MTQPLVWSSGNRRGSDGWGGGALEIRILHRHGKGIREIARETGTSRNTVQRYPRDEPRRPVRGKPCGGRGRGREKLGRVRS